MRSILAHGVSSCGEATIKRGIYPAFAEWELCLTYMREWLSGGASPCQGEGRGFDPRLALSRNTKRISEWISFFVLSRHIRASKVRCLRFAPVGAKPTSPGRRAPSRALGNRRYSVPFFCIHNFEYIWTIMKGKVFNLGYFFKNNLWQRCVVKIIEEPSPMHGYIFEKLT